MGTTYPGPISALQLWQGCVLQSLVEAFYLLTPDALLGNDRVWAEEGRRYVIDFVIGADWGVLQFEGDEVIGALFSHESARSPYGAEIEPFDFRTVYAGMPDSLWDVVQRELVPLMTIPDMDPRPGITAGLWSEDGALRVAEPWPVFMEHGGWLLKDEFTRLDAAIDEVRTWWGLSDEQITIMRRLFARRIRTPRKQMVALGREDLRAALMIHPESEPLTTPRRGLPLWERIAAMRRLLSPLRIVIP